MDLNKTMVNLYKQRSSINKQRSLSNKNNRSRTDDVNSCTKKDISMTENPATQDDSKKINQSPNKKDGATFIDLLDSPVSNVTFEQLHGCDSAREQILDILNEFQNDKEESPEVSNWPILVCGSRGLGKTSLVEAAANYSKLTLIKIPIASMLENYLLRNEFKENLGHLTRHCLASQPAIVLVDDLDQIIDKEDYRYLIRGTIKKLLGQKLLVFCAVSSATNDLCDLNFLCTTQLKRPSLESRRKILKCLFEKRKVFESFTNEDIQNLAVNTPSFTASDLRKMMCLATIESKGRPQMKHCESAIEIVKQSFERGTYLVEERPSITWADIGGMSRVREAFANILKQTRNEGQDCKFAGIALYGPPGCGKTMVAQAMANEAGFNFISIKPTELVNKFLGETEKNIRRVFLEAREYEPCIIYFDEFDGLCGTRGNKDSVTSAIQTLLSEMDGFAKRGQSIILVSTNRLDDIDPAMKRPGRLSKHIYVGPPDEEARKDIINVILKRRQKVEIALGKDVQLDSWAKKTDKFTGADLHFLFDEALARARNESTSSDDKVVLKQENFEQAMKEILETNKELDKKIRSHDSDKVRDTLQKRLKVN